MREDPLRVAPESGEPGEFATEDDRSLLTVERRMKIAELIKMQKTQSGEICSGWISKGSLGAHGEALSLSITPHKHACVAPRQAMKVA